MTAHTAGARAHAIGALGRVDAQDNGVAALVSALAPHGLAQGRRACQCGQAAGQGMLPTASVFRHNYGRDGVPWQDRLARDRCAVMTN